MWLSTDLPVQYLPTFELFPRLVLLPGWLNPSSHLHLDSSAGSKTQFKDGSFYKACLSFSSRADTTSSLLPGTVYCTCSQVPLGDFGTGLDLVHVSPTLTWCLVQLILCYLHLWKLMRQTPTMPRRSQRSTLTLWLCQAHGFGLS